MNKEVNTVLLEKLNEVLFELDVFNAAVVSILVSKNIFTIEEFTEMKEIVRPLIKAKSEEQKEEIDKSLEGFKSNE